ncbi:MAG: ABC transporter permease [Treponema sp.]|jgi:ribose transport system permease protein|nr:ABC transporter permease [Treponema sp.]
MLKEKTKEWVRQNMVVLFLLVIVILFGITSRTFLSLQNLINITSQMSINALLATGLSFVIITGGIDIGVGSVAAFAGIFAAFVGLRFPQATLPVTIIMQIGCAVFIGGLCGTFTGLMITRLNVVPMIASLAMLTMARGAAYVVTNGRPVYGLPSNFEWLGAGRYFKTESMPLGILPHITIFTLIVVMLMHLLLIKTVFGRHIYAIGSNETVAHLSGINVKSVKLRAYIISGIMAALGGVCVASKLNNGQPASCEGYEMYAIASTVLGGTSLMGGSGSVIRAMMGVAIIAIINNGMNLIQVSSYWQKVIMGLIILLAVILDMTQKQEKK